MRKLALGLVVAVGIAAPATAGDLGQFFAGQVYSTRGQCESALMAERNDRRNNDGNTGGYSDPDYNHAVAAKYECVEVAKRMWIVARS